MAKIKRPREETSDGDGYGEKVPKKKQKSGQNDSENPNNENLTSNTGCKQSNSPNVANVTKPRNEAQIDDEPKHEVQAAANDTDNEEKQLFEIGFKWVTFFFCFAIKLQLGSALYYGFSSYVRVALYIVLYNACVYIHHLDARRENWLQKKHERETIKEREPPGLVRSMATANVAVLSMFCVIFTLTNIMKCFSRPTTQDTSCMFDVWGGLIEDTADFFVMVVFISAATTAILHVIFVFVTMTKAVVKKKSEDHKKPALFFLVVSVLVLIWVYDARVYAEPKLTTVPKILQVLATMCLVYALPFGGGEDASKESWGQFVQNKRFFFPHIILSLLAVYWVLDYTSAEPQLTLRIRSQNLLYAILMITFCPSVEENEKERGSSNSDQETNTSDENNFGLVSSLANGVGSVMGFVLMPVKIAVNLTEALVKFTGDLFCTLSSFSPVSSSCIGELLVRFTWLADRACEWRAVLYHIYVECPLTIVFGNVEAVNNYLGLKTVENYSIGVHKAAFFCIAHLLIIYGPKHLTFMNITIATALLYLMQAINHKPHAGVKRLKTLIGELSGPIITGFFLVFFLLLVMLGLSTMFTSLASVLVSPFDGDPFVLTMKRITFFSASGVCCVFLHATFEVVLDSRSDFKTEADNFYTVVFKYFVKEDDQRLSKARVHIKHVLQSLFFFSFMLTSFAVWVQPEQGAPASDYKISSDNLGMFGMSLGRDNATHEHVAYQKDLAHSYSACTIRWRNLSALDHAILAGMAYSQPQEYPEELEGMKKALKYAFPEPFYNVKLDVDWNDHKQRINDREKGLFGKYYKIDFLNQKHTVVVVQGTDMADFGDALTDGRLWIVTVLFDFAEKFIPLLNMLAKRNRARFQWLIERLQARLTIESEQLNAYEPVVKYVHELITNKDKTRPKYTKTATCKNNNCWTISVTGHSLGGGIATIVGSTLGIPSVSFSGPGSVFSKWQFDTTIGNETLYPNLAHAGHLNTVFIPSSDVVPRVDSHIGSLQHTACTVKAPISCHSISAMTCDLLLHCGDGHDQTRFHYCEYSAFKPTRDVNALEWNIL